MAMGQDGRIHSDSQWRDLVCFSASCHYLLHVKRSVVCDSTILVNRYKYILNKEAVPFPNFNTSLPHPMQCVVVLQFRKHCMEGGEAVYCDVQVWKGVISCLLLEGILVKEGIYLSIPHTIDQDRKYA